MRFVFPAITVGLILALPLAAGEDGLTGNWKFSIASRGQQIAFWLLKMESKDGKLNVTATPLDGPEVKVENIKQTGDTFSMTFKASTGDPESKKQTSVLFEYEGKLPKPGAKKIFGSLSRGRETVPALLEATTAKNGYELDRELLLKTPSDPRAIDAIHELIFGASRNNVDAKVLQEWVNLSLKSAELYGPRLQLQQQLRLLESLMEQKAYGAVAVETALKVSKSIDPKLPAETRLQVFAMLADILRKNGKKDEAKAVELDLARKLGKSIDAKLPAEKQVQLLTMATAILRKNGEKDEAKALELEFARNVGKSIDAKLPADAQLQLLTMIADIFRKNDQADDAKKLDARIDGLENTAYAEHAKEALNFKPEKPMPRKGKSGRPVLVELFTGAQCPPCVAADMAFDGLDKTYPVADVVLLQYHLHIPAPDALANADADVRYEYYLEFKKARGTPSALFNGTPLPGGGGARDDAPDKYKEYCDRVNKLLDTPAGAKLTASATRAGDKITIKANVKDLDKPGDKVRLRFALVEDWARYKGRNGLSYHHRIVRAMPGGAKGFTLKQKDAEHTAEVDLDSLRKTLNKYLDEDYPEGARPMRLRSLHVVAFVQDDDSTEVLAALDVAVKEGK